MTVAIEGVEWSAARTGHTLTPGKTRYPFYSRLGWLQDRSGRAEKSRSHRDSIPERPARSQSLYRLSYPTQTRLLGLWIRIPPVAWRSVSCERCVLPGRSLCVGLITCPVESYRVWCVQWVWSRSSVREAMTRNRAETPDMKSLAESAWKKQAERNRRTLLTYLLLCAESFLRS